MLVRYVIVGVITQPAYLGIGHELAELEWRRYICQSLSWQRRHQTTFYSVTSYFSTNARSLSACRDLCNGACGFCTEQRCADGDGFR